MNTYYYVIINSLLICAWSCTDIGAPCSENMDCANECGGTAIIDDCGKCVGGKTGLNPIIFKTFVVFVMVTVAHVLTALV